MDRYVIEEMTHTNHTASNAAAMSQRGFGPVCYNGWQKGAVHSPAWTRYS